MVPSSEAEVSIADLRPRLPSDRGCWAERQRGLATTVVYSNDGVTLASIGAGRIPRIRFSYFTAPTDI